MIPQKLPNASIELKKYAMRPANTISLANSVGYCLNCGAQVSVCGKPFSAELRCQRCGVFNVYENSQQPSRLAD